MKKYFVFALLFSLLSLTSEAQAQLETKKFKISDISECTMNIVLTGNHLLDAVLREEMPNIWSISPYEFCTVEQFDSRKKSKDYYFLLITDSVFGRQEEAGIRSITVFKGDPSASDGTDGLYRIVTIPFCSAEDSDGRESSYLPALVDILQFQIQEILDKEFNIGDMVKVKAANTLKTWSKPVLIASSDLAIPVTDRMKGRNIVITDEEEVDAAMRSRDPQYLIAYSVAPSSASRDAVCFTMIIDAETHELYYLRRRKSNVNTYKGFTKSDIEVILAHGRK